ncbi:hypothetical protein NX059_002226 [Plenodomus lindquistii]|nr:hypothetical protein NX059_002226 [Plenodomus lindquistii]
MLLIVYLFLLLLPLSSAIRNSSSAHAESFQRRSGCHDRLNANSEMIVFRSQSEDAFEYAITTPYKKYYPKLLLYALQANKFELSVWRKDQECGWIKRDSVYGPLGIVSANHRGDTY